MNETRARSRTTSTPTSRLDQGVAQHLRRGDLELAGGGDVPA
jgi:hypothetical protein